MTEYCVLVTSKAVREVIVRADSKSEARIKALNHDVLDVQDDFDLTPVSAGKAVEITPRADTSNFKI